MLLEGLPRGGVIAVDGSASMVREAAARLDPIEDADHPLRPARPRPRRGGRRGLLQRRLPLDPRPRRGSSRFSSAALRPGGRVEAQCGGEGNVARFRAAVAAVAAEDPYRDLPRRLRAPTTSPRPRPRRCACARPASRRSAAGCGTGRSALPSRGSSSAPSASAPTPIACRRSSGPGLLDGVMERLGPEPELDYVRLNISARKGDGPGPTPEPRRRPLALRVSRPACSRALDRLVGGVLAGGHGGVARGVLQGLRLLRALLEGAFAPARRRSRPGPRPGVPSITSDAGLVDPVGVDGAGVVVRLLRRRAVLRGGVLGGRLRPGGVLAGRRRSPHSWSPRSCALVVSAARGDQTAGEQADEQDQPSVVAHGVLRSPDCRVDRTIERGHTTRHVDRNRRSSSIRPARPRPPRPGTFPPVPDPDQTPDAPGDPGPRGRRDRARDRRRRAAGARRGR